MKIWAFGRITILYEKTMWYYLSNISFCNKTVNIIKKIVKYKCMYVNCKIKCILIKESYLSRVLQQGIWKTSKVNFNCIRCVPSKDESLKGVFAKNE